jgi:multidrug resistance protein, MATE family
MDSVAIGLLTAMDTLTSQAYGAKNFRRVGIVFQRAMFILALLVVPVGSACSILSILCSSIKFLRECGQVASLWWYIKPILLALDQPTEVCDKATRYARFLTLGLLPYFGFEALRRFLQAQGIAKPMLVVSVITSVCHPVVNYIFIYRFGLGYDGAPLSVITSQWIMFVSLLLYTLIRRPHTPETWAGFDREALSELGVYLKLALPGGTV